jgi:ligand-binding SRPBCC domain-containing protein
MDAAVLPVGSENRMRYHFKTEQWLPFPLEQVFVFFAEPDNLPRLMPAWQAARIDSATFVPPQPAPQAFPGSDSIRAGNGTTLVLTARVLPFVPVRTTWIAQIEDFRWLGGFCDVQLKGPFKYWRHCHSVAAAERDGRAGTLLQDAVEYEPPFGALGALANALLLHRQIASAFDFRHKRTIELLNSTSKDT